MKRQRSTSPTPESSVPRGLSHSAPPSRSSSPVVNLSARPATPPVTEKHCLCHVHADETRNFKLFSETTWKSFQNATFRRCDDIASAMQNKWADGPNGGYHLRCYQTYITIRKNIPSQSVMIVHDSAGQSQDNVSLPRAKRTRRSGSSEAMEKEMQVKKEKPCLICGSNDRKKVKVSGRWIFEKLTPCVTQNANDKLLDAAKSKENFLMVAEIKSCGDAMAGDIVYHRTCYRKYTKDVSGQAEEGTETSKENSFKTAFRQLCSEFEKDVIFGLDVQLMSDLRDKYVKLLAKQEISAPNFRTSKLKRKLQKEYGSLIEFGQQRQNQSEFVFSTKLSRSQIVRAWMVNEEQRANEGTGLSATSTHSVTDDSNLFHAAKMLRMELLKIKSMLPKVPRASDIDESSVTIPDDVFNFLAWALTDNCDPSPDERAEVNERDRRLIVSIAQDMVYMSNKQKVLTPKHLGLAHTVRNLTGSSELVNILSKQGHCVSYPTMIRHEHDLEKLQHRGNEIHLPLNIQKGVYITFVWDNNDLNQETLSGGDTTHHTNGIILQRPVLGCPVPPGFKYDEPQEPDTESETILANTIIPYYSQARKGLPSPLKIPQGVDPFSYSPENYKLACRKDLVWCMLRMEFIQNNLFDLQYSLDEIEQQVPGKDTLPIIFS